MAHITSREQLEDWLKDKPDDWKQIIASRAGQRALPYSFVPGTPDEWVLTYSLVPFRSTLMSWSACNHADYPLRKAFDVFGEVSNMAATQATDFDDSRAYSAIYASGHAVSAMYPWSEFDKERGINDALELWGSQNRLMGCLSNAVAYAEMAVGSHVMRSIHHDCNWLEAANASDGLGSVALWKADPPYGWNEAWVSAANRLLALDPTYQVWIDWYNRRIEGHDAAFEIPDDTGLVQDKAILARLANATNEDFWDKGATYVNTTLQGWIDEARERVRQSETPDEPPPTPDAIRAIAAEIASPTVILTNNTLDVIANTAFDGQTDASNLDEAIAVLRAVVGALLGGLPGNAPRSFVANLTIYDGELAKRDAKPFLGVLVRMEKSVSAGFYADPEMFDVSVTTNFESYFDAHLAFMTHYRRNEEREAKIAQFTINDAAASGVALTDPVDEVVKEVDALAEQGLVTDGFAQAMKEQKAINDEVALYTSSAPAISGEPTIKARHILQTVGFYERALAVASNASTVAKPLVAFIKILKEAIEALLKFFV